MTSRIPTLVIYARRVPSLRGALVETLASLVGVLDASSQPAGRLRRLGAVLDRNSYASLSYVNDWLEAFRNSPRLQVTAANIVDLRQFQRARRLARHIPLIVVLHSAAGDDVSLLRLLSGPLQARRGRLLMFFGNEYCKMREKIALAGEVGTNYIASQLPRAAAKWLYERCKGAVILDAPAALNPNRYYALPVARPIDIGFRGDLYPYSIGDVERTCVLQHFREHIRHADLKIDIEFVRKPAEQWREFLNSCSGIVGAESGTYYLERDDATAMAVDAYLAEFPAVSFADVYEKFFRHYGPAVSGKAISSRHFEAVGTKTCQILLEGHYNGILVADQHYLSVNRDLSNVADVVARFKDTSYRNALVERAYAFVHDAHTYARRVAELIDTVEADGV